MSGRDVRASGFTLMELVVATAITSVLFVGLAAAVGGGFMAWRKALYGCSFPYGASLITNKIFLLSVIVYSCLVSSISLDGKNLQ